MLIPVVRELPSELMLGFPNIMPSTRQLVSTCCPCIYNVLPGMRAQTHIWWRWRRSIVEDRTENRQEKGSGLARTGLSTSHEVTLIGNDGNSILLHWGRLGVLGKLVVEIENTR